MKKKFLKFILAVCCILPCSALLTACGGGGGGSSSNPNHTHSYDSWMPDSTNTTRHYRACSCGETEYAEHSLSYESTGSPDTTHWATCSVCGYEASENHSYRNGICGCGYIPETDCLTFEYVDQSYKVTGITLTQSTNLNYIRIPAFYDDNTNGLFAVTAIGADAFKNAYNFRAEKVIIPNTVTEIGENAFYGRLSIKEIQIANIFATDSPSVLTTIGNSAFSGCKNLTTINLPESLTTIGDNAFYDCEKLANVTLSSNVTTIGAGAFENCKSFTSINFPVNAVSIGSRVVAGCSNLTTLTIDAHNSKYFSQNNCLIHRADDSNHNSRQLVAGIKTSEIPDDFSGQISDYAFCFVDGLTNVHIPEYVYGVGDRAFYGCKDLESITVSKSNAQYKAEGNCLISYSRVILGCKNSTIPSSVTGIYNEAFAYCTGLTSLVVPNNVTEIKENAFIGCKNLTTLTLPFVGTDASNTGNFGLKGLFDRANSYVPVENFTLSQGTTLPANAFSGCGNLKNVTLPETLTSIGDRAFEECNGLKTFVIPDSVTSIGEAIFYGCGNLTSVTLSAKMSTLSAGTFIYCRNLETVIIPEGVTEIAVNAFDNCSKLKNLVLPTSLTTVNAYAFGGCTEFNTNGKIFYSGDSTAWATLEDKIGFSSIENFKNATVYYYSETSATSGWHYVNNTPTIW